MDGIKRINLDSWDDSHTLEWKRAINKGDEIYIDGRRVTEPTQIFNYSGALQAWDRGDDLEVVTPKKSSEQTVTLKMPLTHWDGIINGIEKYVGNGADSDIEILSEIELVEGNPSAIWWLNGYYDRK